MTSAEPNLVTRLTPPGKAAIACLGVAGPQAWQAVRQLFRRPRGLPLPDAPAPRQVYFGTLGDRAAGADDVVLFVRAVAPTFLAEIHCHGGPEVVRLIESLFVAHGLGSVSLEGWNTRVHGSDRAARLNILARAVTSRTAAIALDQCEGALERALAAIDADVAAGRVHDATAKTARLRELIPVGEHLCRPWKVAIAGEPNVGKSSLVNALAGFTRSIVAPTPGTTRDVVSTTIALDGWPIELIDTAGLRASGDALEQAGIERGRIESESADLVLRVVDSTAVEMPVLGSRDLLVINKIDLKPDCPRRKTGAAVVSARTGEGLGELADQIVNRLVPNPPRPGEAVPLSGASF
jgi:tRNA modification GTPase